MRKSVTVTAVILLILVLLAGGLFVCALIPHKQHFRSVWIRTYAGNTSNEYLAYTSFSKCFIDSDAALQDFLEDNDEEYDNGIGEQTLKVRFTGFRTYRTDNSGIFMSYPIPVYEYTGD